MNDEQKPSDQQEPEDELTPELCGHSLDKACRLDLCLDFALSAAFVAFGWTVLVWLGY